MKVYRTFRTALKGLLRNPMRAMLTTLGIVIGVAAVIAMMEIGAGSSAAIRKSIAGMGANVLDVLDEIRAAADELRGGMLERAGLNLWRL